MVLKCIQKPEHEPVGLLEVEGQCRITDLSDEAATIALFISAIRQRAEAITRRAFITQKWRLTLTGFPSGIKIPLPPLQTVDSIQYVDLDGILQTLDPTAYRVNTDEEPAEVRPAYGTSWPATLNDVNTVIVEFTCGYGPTEEDTSDNVPEGIKQWMLLNVASLYENRESVTIETKGVAIDLSRTLADGLLDDFRVFGW